MSDVIMYAGFLTLDKLVRRRVLSRHFVITNEMKLSTWILWKPGHFKNLNASRPAAIFT